MWAKQLDLLVHELWPGLNLKKKTGIGEHAELSDKVIYSHNFVYNDEERLILRAVS